MTKGHGDDTFHVPDPVRRGEATAWLNPRRQPASAVLPTLPFTIADVEAAAARWLRFAPLLKRLFADLPDGTIDSPFVRLPPGLGARVSTGDAASVWVKADHALPVTGCIKARGGIYEVLVTAEALALRAGLLREGPSTARLADEDAPSSRSTRSRWGAPATSASASG